MLSQIPQDIPQVPAGDDEQISSLLTARSATGASAGRVDTESSSDSAAGQ